MHELTVEPEKFSLDTDNIRKHNDTGKHKKDSIYFELFSKSKKTIHMNNIIARLANTKRFIPISAYCDLLIVKSR